MKQLKSTEQQPNQEPIRKNKRELNKGNQDHSSETNEEEKRHQEKAKRPKIKEKMVIDDDDHEEDEMSNDLFQKGNQSNNSDEEILVEEKSPKFQLGKNNKIIKTQNPPPSSSFSIISRRKREPIQKIDDSFPQKNLAGKNIDEQISEADSFNFCFPLHKEKYFSNFASHQKQIPPEDLIQLFKSKTHLLHLLFNFIFYFLFLLSFIFIFYFLFLFFYYLDFFPKSSHSNYEIESIKDIVFLYENLDFEKQDNQENTTGKILVKKNYYQSIISFLNVLFSNKIIEKAIFLVYSYNLKNLEYFLQQKKDFFKIFALENHFDIKESQSEILKWSNSTNSVLIVPIPLFFYFSSNDQDLFSKFNNSNLFLSQIGDGSEDSPHFYSSLQSFSKIPKVFFTSLDFIFYYDRVKKKIFYSFIFFLFLFFFLFFIFIIRIFISFFIFLFLFLRYLKLAIFVKDIALGEKNCF